MDGSFFGNFNYHDTVWTVIVWDPSVSVVVYQASAQLVTFDIFIHAQDFSFVYGFNMVEKRYSL